MSRCRVCHRMHLVPVHAELCGPCQALRFRGQIWATVILIIGASLLAALLVGCGSAPVQKPAPANALAERCQKFEPVEGVPMGTFCQKCEDAEGQFLRCEMR